MNFSSKDLAEIFEALAFAADKHKSQKRKDHIGTPYINHPVGLLRKLAFLPDIEVYNLIGGVLHDVVEDTKTTIREIEIRFGKQVADLVAEVTNDKNLTGDESKEHELERAKTLSLQAALIRIADKDENISDITLDQPVGWNIERKLKYITWAKNLVDNIEIEDQSINILKYSFYQRYYEKLHLFK